MLKRLILSVNTLLLCLVFTCSRSDQRNSAGGFHSLITDKSFTRIDTLYPDIVFNSNNNTLMGHPAALKYNSNNGQVYALDAKDDNIKLFTEELMYLNTFGRFGQGPGEFSRPYNIVFDPAGNIYVYESQNMRIQIFDHQLNYLSVIPIKFLLPFNNFDVDSSGRIYYPNRTLDSNFLISVIDTHGKLVEEFGEKLSYDDYPSHQQHHINYVYVCMDENNLYCCFNHEPILRKYNAERELLLEINLAQLYDAKMYKEFLKKQNPAQVIPTYFSFIAVDTKYIYVSLATNFAPEIHGTSNTMYLFDKNTGNPVLKNVLIVSEDSEMEHVPDFDVSHPKYYFFVEQASGSLVRFPKN